MAIIPKKLPRDTNQRAIAIARLAIGDDPANADPRPAASVLTSRAKASKGGVARSAAMPADKRRTVAKKAAEARWRKP